MAKKKNNYIPTKNYIIAIFISISAIFLTYYFFSWYHLYQENEYSESYLLRTNTISLEVNDINEIESTFTEAPNEYFVYIGYRNDENVYKLEKQLKKVIDKYNLNDNFYYIDVTTLKEEPNYLENLNQALNLDNEKITQVPTILFYQNGNLAKEGIITREDQKLMEIGDFEKLLDIYEIKK